MDKGRLLRDCSFDDLREEFCRAKLTSLNGPLPEKLPFSGIVDCRREESCAIVTLQNCPQQQIEQQAKAMNCQVQIQPLTLDEIYRIIVGS